MSDRCSAKVSRVVMNHESAVSNAKEIADRILAPAARQNDKEGRFSSEAIAALGPAGLLGIMLPSEVGGSALAPEGKSPTDSTLYLVAGGTPGLSVAGPWDGLGMRANASAPMILEDCEVAPSLQLTDDGAGFKAMLEVVLPLFNLGTSAVALGLCRAAVAGTAAHLNGARFEHLGQTLGESLPTLRAQLATMQIDTDGLAARVDDLVDHLERPRDTTMLRVLESKASAGAIAIAVTSAAMRVCGGAAFSKHMAIERLFRDAHAGAVMAPTGDVLREFIGKAILGMPLF